MKEIWDLFNKNRERTGLTHIRGENVPKGFYHIVVEIWTIIDNRKILLTQRHKNKPYGLFWECTGGSILQGESSLQGAVREIKEEIGLHIKEDNLEKVMEYIVDDSMYDVYVNYQNEKCLDKIALQENEVIDFKCTTYEELTEMIKKEEVVPKLAYVKKLIEDRKIHLTIA